MSRCVSITKKGDRCRNKALDGFDRCHTHAEKQSYAVPEPKILNPYLGIQVDPDEEDNCGSDRLRLARIPRRYPVIRGILSRYCDVLPLKDVKYIVGPNQYTEFRYKNYKIGIFGEGSHSIHDFPLPLSSKTTLTFSAFLTSLVTQTKRQYDFFAELPYRNRVLKAKEISDVNFMLNVLEYDFKDCLKVEKAEKAACPYKNLRIHYSDARELYPEYDNLAFEIYSYDDVKKAPGHKVNKFLKTLLKEYDEQTRFVERVLQDKTSKIEKQLRHNELRVREQITEYIKYQMQDNKRKFMIYLNQSSETINKDFRQEPFTQEDIDVIRLLANEFILIFTPIMDTYLLGRIFRTYPNDSGGSPENIIIYAGGYHTELYTSFLYYIGANKTIDILNRESLYYLEFRDEDKARSFLFNP